MKYQKALGDPATKSGVVYILDAFELRNIFSLIIVFIFGVVLRVLAYYKKWHLPTLSKEN